MRARRLVLFTAAALMAGALCSAGVLIGPAAACTPVPGIVSVDPDATTAPTNSRIILAGNGYLVNETSLHVSVAGSPIAGTLSEIASGAGPTRPQTFAFTPAAPFSAGDAVSVILDSSASAGLTTSWSFTIGNSADSTAPTGGAFTGGTFTNQGGDDFAATFHFDPPTDDAGPAFLLVTITDADGSFTDVLTPGQTDVALYGGSFSCSVGITRGTTFAITTQAFDLAGNVGAEQHGTYTVPSNHKKDPLCDVAEIPEDLAGAMALAPLAALALGIAVRRARRR